MAVTSEPLGNTTGAVTSLVVHCSVLTRRLWPSTATVLVVGLQVTSSFLVVVPLDPDSDVPVPAVPAVPAGLGVDVAVPDSGAVRTPTGELPPIGAVDPFAYGMFRVAVRVPPPAVWERTERRPCSSARSSSFGSSTGRRRR